MTLQKRVLFPPKFGGAPCPELSSSVVNYDCVSNEVCSRLNTKYSSDLNRFNIPYTPDTNVWNKFNCNLLKNMPTISPTDLVCTELAKMNMEESKRAMFLLECPGSGIINIPGFFGAGNVTSTYFTITIDPSSSTTSVYNFEILESSYKNLNKKIRVWYDNNKTITGWAISSDWVYPDVFGTKTIKDFGFMNDGGPKSLIISNRSSVDTTTNMFTNKIVFTITAMDLPIQNTTFPTIINNGTNLSLLRMDYSIDYNGDFLGTKIYRTNITFNTP